MAEVQTSARTEALGTAHPRVPLARRSKILLALAVLLASGSANPRLRADRASIGEYQVKAAFLYNFAKFVDWPGGSAGSTIVIGVLGADPFGAVLDFTFEDKVVAGRRFEVRRFQRLDQLQACQVLFISDSEQDNLGRILGVVRGLPVLTVSDARNFANAGGMIELVLEDKKIRFDINLKEAKQSGLRISAQLLQLARRVEGR